MESTPLAPRSLRFFGLAVICLALAALAARINAPSDLWDQTQPRTIAYTADMVTRGGTAWILAKDALGFPATKPPLYNWLATPAVAVFGRASEIAHKSPSLIAMAAIVAILVALGRRIAPAAGWLAALAWLACYPTFKLGYLARPDMMLCLVLLVGWWSVARLLVPNTLEAENSQVARSNTLIVAAFWGCVVLAGWLKGPVAIVLPLFAIVASLIVHRSIAPLKRFRAAWGVPLVLVLTPLWYGAVAFIDSHHLIQSLWHDEIFGRVTGVGPEGGRRGIGGTLRGLLDMPFYFMVRFGPWSVAALLGGLALLDRRHNGGVARWRTTPSGDMLLLATVWVVMLIGVFSWSSGKRADYIAPAYAPAALVAAWWLLKDRFSPLRGAPWLAVPIAALLLAAMGVAAWRLNVYTAKTMERFQSVVTALEALPRDMPLVVIAPQMPHWAILAATPTPSENTIDRVHEYLDRGQSVRVLMADLAAMHAVYPLVEDGRGSLVWSISHTEEALQDGYPSPAMLVELHPPSNALR